MLLETIENKLRALFEGTLDRMLYPGISSSLSSRLVALISEKIASQPPATRRAPDLIDILICPDKWDAWQSARPALEDAARELEAFWVDQGYTFLYSPRIKVIADLSSAPRRLTFTSITHKATACKAKLPCRRSRARWGRTNQSYQCVSDH